MMYGIYKSYTRIRNEMNVNKKAAACNMQQPFSLYVLKQSLHHATHASHTWGTH